MKKFLKIFGLPLLVFAAMVSIAAVTYQGTFVGPLKGNIWTGYNATNLTLRTGLNLAGGTWIASTTNANLLTMAQDGTVYNAGNTVFVSNLTVYATSGGFVGNLVGNVTGNATTATTAGSVTPVTKAAFSTNYTVQSTDSILFCTGTQQVITLPNANSVTVGKPFTFICASTTAGSLIITNANGSQKIMNSLFQNVSTASRITVVSDGSNWW